MAIPETNFDPPFNVTRASHVRLTTPDLEASRTFYEEVIGLLVSDTDAETVHMRGVEEACHHSLTLQKSDGPPVCEAVGFRVFRDEDLDRAKHYFDSRGVPAEWVERPFEHRTLKVTDPNRVPLELVARMDVRERHHVDLQLHRGGGALRLDHFQFAVPDVAAAAEFYADIGFRTSSYFTDQRFGDHVFGIFMYRKDNPHDAVFMTRVGPRFHHFGCIVTGAEALFKACDIAGNIGFAANIERGPGRHGQGHSLYTYFRDPAGHRVELLPPPIQMTDIEDVAVEWEESTRFTWGLPPPRSWLEDASPFPGVPLREPEIQQPPVTIEQVMERQAS